MTQQTIQPKHIWVDDSSERVKIYVETEDNKMLVGEMDYEDYLLMGGGAELTHLPSTFLEKITFETIPC